jgi:cellobiose-specific phosphotransferase system component IIC
MAKETKIMTEETDNIDQAIARGNNAVAAKAAGQEIPSGLVRDPIYTWVYLGGLGVYGLLIAFFLL